MSVELDPSHFDSNCVYTGPASKLIILFYSMGCGHCKTYHPKYAEAAAIGSQGVLFTECNTSEGKYSGFLQNIRGPLSPFSFQGVPTVVSYSGQKYYSTYAPSDSNFRTPEDTVQYANGIGSADITYV